MYVFQVPERIPLQPVDKSMVKQVVPLKPMEDHGGEDIPTAALGQPMLEQAAGRTGGPVGNPRWGIPLLTDCSLWKGPTLGQCLKSCRFQKRSDAASSAALSHNVSRGLSTTYSNQPARSCSLCNLRGWGRSPCGSPEPCPVRSLLASPRSFSGVRTLAVLFSFCTLVPDEKPLLRCRRASQASSKHQNRQICIRSLRGAQKPLQTSTAARRREHGSRGQRLPQLPVTDRFSRSCPCAPETPCTLSGTETQGFSEGGAGICHSLDSHAVKTATFQSGLTFPMKPPHFSPSANKRALGAFTRSPALSSTCSPSSLEKIKL